VNNKPSRSPYMSVRAVAEHYCVSVATIRQKRGAFAALKHVSTGTKEKRGRTLILRSSVEELDQALQQPAQTSEGLRLVTKKRA
jgi:hypothetical protein